MIRIRLKWNVDFRNFFANEAALRRIDLFDSLFLVLRDRVAERVRFNKFDQTVANVNIASTLVEAFLAELVKQGVDLEFAHDEPRALRVAVSQDDRRFFAHDLRIAFVESNARIDDLRERAFRNLNQLFARTAVGVSFLPVFEDRDIVAPDVRRLVKLASRLIFARDLDPYVRIEGVFERLAKEREVVVVLWQFKAFNAGREFGDRFGIFQRVERPDTGLRFLLKLGIREETVACERLNAEKSARLVGAAAQDLRALVRDKFKFFRAQRLNAFAVVLRRLEAFRDMIENRGAVLVDRRALIAVAHPFVALRLIVRELVEVRQFLTEPVLAAEQRDKRVIESRAPEFVGIGSVLEFFVHNAKSLG